MMRRLVLALILGGAVIGGAEAAESCATIGQAYAQTVDSKLISAKVTSKNNTSYCELVLLMPTESGPRKRETVLVKQD